MGHWYDSKGAAKYEVERKDGKGMRPTTLADAKKQNLFYSTSDIIGLVNHPWLERWKQNLLLDVALSYTPSSSESVEWSKSKIFKHYEEYKDEKTGRVLGNNIHNQLDEAFRAAVRDENGEIILLQHADKKIGDSLEFLFTKFPQVSDWISEMSFSHRLGYGGKIDLISLKHKIVVDFKTKMRDTLDDSLVTEANIMQLAAYTQGLGWSPPNCYVMLISTLDGVKPHLYRIPDKEIEKGVRMFNLLLEFHKLKNNYDPIGLVASSS